jgi:hypothetical protein
MKDFCIFACSDEFQLFNSLEFIKITQNLCLKLGITLSHIEYFHWYDDPDKSNHEMVFNPENVRNLQWVFSKKRLTSLILRAENENADELIYLNLESKIKDFEVDNYKYVFFHFPMKFIENWSQANLFSFSSDLLASLNQMGRLDYALITTMEAHLVSTFFTDIFTEDLSKEQEMDIAIWGEQFVHRKMKLRNLYWGNLLSASHLARVENKSELIELFALSSCLHSPINGDDLFFLFPSDDLAAHSASPIRSFLDTHDLLMKLSDDEIRFFKRQGKLGGERPQSDQ